MTDELERRLKIIHNHPSRSDAENEELKAKIRQLETDQAETKGRLKKAEGTLEESRKNQNQNVVVKTTQAVNDADENLAREVEKNFEKMLGGLDNDSLMNVVMAVPLYETGNKEHDELVSDIIDVREMESRDEAVRAKALKNITKEIVNDKDTPEWVKKTLPMYEPDHIMFRRHITGKKKCLARYLVKNGEIGRSRLRALIQDSLAKAHEEYSHTANPSQSKLIWKEKMMPYYLAIANPSKIKAEYDFNEDIKQVAEDENRGGISLATWRKSSGREDYDERQERIEDAIKTFKTAIFLNPELVSAYYNLGTIYAHKAEYDKAIVELQKAIGLDPDTSAYHNNLGLCHFKKGNLHEAIKEYDAAMRLDPDARIPKMNLSSMKTQVKRSYPDSELEDYRY